MKSDAVRTFFFENRSKRCIVYGNSMQPFLSFGESVEIEPCAGRLRRGHCYAFIAGKRLAIHRFISMTDKEYALFAGDNCLFLDRVALSDIIGELSSCQNRGILSIINTINSLFCVLMRHFRKILVLNRIRRRSIKLVLYFEKKRGQCNEEKI
jgi:hypothetical protein